MAKKIKIHYRAPSHVPLWKVMEEGGFSENMDWKWIWGRSKGNASAPPKG